MQDALGSSTCRLCLLLKRKEFWPGSLKTAISAVGRVEYSKKNCNYGAVLNWTTKSDSQMAEHEINKMGSDGVFNPNVADLVLTHPKNQMNWNPKFRSQVLSDSP